MYQKSGIINGISIKTWLVYIFMFVGSCWKYWLSNVIGDFIRRIFYPLTSFACNARRQEWQGLRKQRTFWRWYIVIKTFTCSIFKSCFGSYIFWLTCIILNVIITKTKFDDLKKRSRGPRSIFMKSVIDKHTNNLKENV